MNSSILLLVLSTALCYGSPSRAETAVHCLGLFHKVVFRNATALDVQQLTNCFDSISKLHGSLSFLASTSDVEDFSTKCFADFLNYARGQAMAKQIGRLHVCGWDTVKILHEFHKSDNKDVEIPLNNALAALMRTSGETFASKCLHHFEKAVTGPKSAIERDALAECGAALLRQAKYAVKRYTELTLLEDSSIKKSDVEENLDSMEEMTNKCMTHFIKVLTGSEKTEEGGLAYCGGVFMTTTRLFVDIATGKDPLNEPILQ